MKEATKKPGPAKAGFIGIPIERGIAIPPRRGSKGRPPGDVAKALLRLEVGESIAIPLERRKRLSWAAATWGRKTGRKFIVRELDGFARCWRVK